MRRIHTPFLALVLVACTPSGTEPTPKRAPDASAPTEEGPPSAAELLPPGDGPVATVNGVDVPRARFEREFIRTIERYQRARHDVKPALRERLKDNIVRRLVDQQIIAQQAKKMGISLDPVAMDRRWAEHKKRYGSEDAFRAYLERAGTTAEDVRRDFDENYLREQVFRRVGEQVNVTGQNVRAYYEANRARYDEPEMVRASHILIRVAPGTPEAELEERRALAERVREAAVAKGADFANLAKKHGEDPTKDRGGDLGYFQRGRMVKAFEEAVWDLKVGEVTPVVRTQFGFHVIKKTGYREAARKPFEAVSDLIERSLLARKRNEAIREAMMRWREEADVEVFVKGDPDIINAGYDRPVVPETPDYLRKGRDARTSTPSAP